MKFVKFSMFEQNLKTSGTNMLLASSVCIL